MSETPTTDRVNFSVKDISLVVSYVVVGTLAYANLKQANDRAHDRIALVEAKLDGAAIAALPKRIDRLEYLLCFTDDKAREAACDRLGVLQ
jgi:hypothetical protein